MDAIFLKKMHDESVSLDGSSTDPLTMNIGYLGSELIRIIPPAGAGTAGKRRRRRRRQVSVSMTAVVDITTTSPAMTTAAVDKVLEPTLINYNGPPIVKVKHMKMGSHAESDPNPQCYRRLDPDPIYTKVANIVFKVHRYEKYIDKF